MLVIILLCYSLAGALGLQIASVNGAVTPLWAPTGIAIAAMVLYGYRVWPAVFFGSIVTGIISHDAPFTILIGASAGIVEAFIATYFLNRYANGKNTFDTVRTTVLFILFSGILSTMIGATIGADGLVLSGRIPWQEFSSVWSTWWLGDLGGALLVAPLLILWLNKPVRVNIRLLSEYIIFLLILGVLSYIVFSNILPHPYFFIPLLVLGAFRFGQRGETFALFFIALIAIITTVHGIGPYTRRDIVTGLLNLELFLTLCASTVYIVTAALLERQKAQSGLASHEKRFRSLIEKSSDAIVLIDADSRISYASPSTKTILGYAPEELIGKVGFDLIYPQDRQYAMKTLAKLAGMPGGTLRIQYRTIRKDKKVIWTDTTGTNLLFDGIVNAVVINFHDITEGKQIQEKIEEDKAEDEAILASIGEGMIATDEKGRITLVNRATCEMLAFTKAELIGKDFATMVQMQDAGNKTIPEEARPLFLVLQKRKSSITSSNNYYIRSDKTAFPVRFTITPIMIDGKVTGTVEVFRDITHEIEVDRAKSEFVSLASHQLRSPLTTIDWYVEAIMNNRFQKLSPEDQKDIKEVYHATKRMVELVNSLLDASQIELGTFPVMPKEVEYQQILAEVLKNIEGQIKMKHITVKQQVVPKIIPIMADPKLLFMIIENLLSNAIKYSKEGSTVAVSISLDERGYTLSVTDAGIGIQKKDEEKIFTKMFRSDNAKLVDREGTGLGLYIIKSIIDATGGKITFHSVPNNGTTFSVWYPKAGMKKKSDTKIVQ